MAEFGGISESEYIMFENGKVDLPLSVVINLLNHLGYKLIINSMEDDC